MPNPYARHGDLVIYAVASIPEAAKRTSSKLLQRGSSDAADHTVAGGTLYRLEGGARVWIRVAREARISHAARHTTGTLPRGEYVVVRLVQATDAGVLPVED